MYKYIWFIFTLYSSSFKSQQILQTSAEYTTDLMPNAWMICAHSKPWGPNNNGKLEACNPWSCLIQLVTNRSWHKMLRLHELAKENFKTSFIGTNKNTTLFGNGSVFSNDISVRLVPFHTFRLGSTGLPARLCTKHPAEPSEWINKWLIHAKQPENAHNWKKRMKNDGKKGTSSPKRSTSSQAFRVPKNILTPTSPPLEPICG